MKAAPTGSAASSVSTAGRRAFLAAMASAVAACRVARDGAPEATAPDGTASTAAPAPADGITLQTLIEAEKIAAVRYSDQERAQLLESLDAFVARAQLLRAHRQPNELAPATVFDPRLPGVPIPSRPRSVRFASRSTALPDDEDIAFASVLDLAHWIERRKITSERLTELYLDRLRTIGAKLECVVTLTTDVALEQAKEADRQRARGRYAGPLHGIPWGAKDLFEASAIATTWGATPYREQTGRADAAVVERLARANAVLVAKLTTGALAYGDIWFGGRTRNPWNLEEGSSGSSAGPAAAVAAGCVGFALGTETLGSIVSPSMRCGTAGLRPTFGRVPRSGAMALCWSLDKVGPLARRAEDTLAVLAAIEGQHDGDPSSISSPLHYDPAMPLQTLRVGVLQEAFEGDAADPLDRQALAALEGLGVQTVPVTLPDLPYAALLTILFVEAAAAFEDLTLDDLDDALVWQGAEAWPNTFRASRFITAIDYVSAQRLRREVMVAFARIFDDVHAIVAPSYAGPMLLATNCTGHPCLVVRTGFRERPPQPFVDGQEPADKRPKPCPHGISLWGRLFDEGTLCRLGSALEQALGVADRRPPI